MRYDGLIQSYLDHLSSGRCQDEATALQEVKRLRELQDTIRDAIAERNKNFEQEHP